MGTQEKMEREINLVELFWNILIGWRQIICFAAIFAVLFGGFKYISDRKSYNTSLNIDEGEITLTQDEKEKIENAKIMSEQIADYQKYLDESILMQIDPYKKPTIELQYYVESDYTYNYTKDNLNDYTGSLMSLYYNYIRSGEMGDKVIENANLSIKQTDYSELCFVSLNGSTMVITFTWPEQGKLDMISEFIKSELERKEADFQEVGAHKLKLLNESQNVIVDSSLAERKNTLSNNIIYIKSQLDTLKSGMSEQELELLNSTNDLENGIQEKIIPKPALDLKYMILGAIFGVVLICVWIVCKVLFTIRIQNSGEVCSLFNVRLLGEINVKVKKKRFLSIIDDKLLSIKNRRKKKMSPEEQIKMIVTNIVLSCERRKIDCIYITGSDYEKNDEVVMTQIKDELKSQNIHVKEGGNIFYDAESLKKCTETGNIVFVEHNGKSIYDEISNEINLAREQNNYILGMVIFV